MNSGETALGSRRNVFSRIFVFLDRLSYPVFLLVASVLAFLIVIYFFCPRFVLWLGLDLGTPISFSNPEVMRALSTMKKIEHPFQFIANQDSMCHWRLLFPLLGHYLYIPRFLFLCLPHLGCLLVFAFTVHLVCKSTNDRLIALGTAVLMGTSSWFFVSTGWLTYFDSWYLLGLLIVGFSPSLWATAMACFLTPWVDERFVITLPISVLVRCVYFSRLGEREWKANFRDLLVIGGAALPWVVFRLVIMLAGKDPFTLMSQLELNGSFSHIDGRTVHYDYVIRSHWYGLRAVWAFVVASVWYAFPPKRRLWTMAMIGVILVAEIPLMAVSGDWARDMATLIPAALLGILLLYRFKTNWLKDWLCLALAFNLLAPAIHGFSFWQYPVNSLYTEIEHYKNPPDYLNPLAYNQVAINLAQQGDWTNALTNLNYALCLDSKQPVVLFNRSRVRQRLGDEAGANSDMEKAFRVAPAGWVRRPQVARSLIEPFTQ